MKLNHILIILSVVSAAALAMEQDMNAPTNLSSKNTAGAGQIAGGQLHIRGFTSMQYYRDDVDHDDSDGQI